MQARALLIATKSLIRLLATLFQVWIGKLELHHFRRSILFLAPNLPATGSEIKPKPNNARAQPVRLSRESSACLDG